jgi:hypothetical protein
MFGSKVYGFSCLFFLLIEIPLLVKRDKRVKGIVEGRYDNLGLGA